MSSLQRNRPRRGELGFGKKTLVAILICVITGGLLYGLRTGLDRVFSPLWQVRNATADASHGFFSLFRDKGNLVKENTDLKDRLESDEELIYSLRAIAGSRDELLLAFGRTIASGTPVSILNRPPETPYDVLLIDGGENLQMREGDVVELPSGIPVGVITAVRPTVSEVTLYSSSGRDTPAVLERSNVPIVLHGRGGSNFEFDVPRDTQVVKGDRILSSTLDTRLLAVVGEAEAAPTDASLTVLAKSPLNISTLRYLLVRSHE